MLAAIFGDQRIKGFRAWKRVNKTQVSKPVFGHLSGLYASLTTTTAATNLNYRNTLWCISPGCFLGFIFSGASFSLSMLV